ncbi:GIY-YIG nuclease family protein [Leptolyngbya sp. CCNP1308]|uniref:GIY-YIG nuclease family protein n=1 Tax=Leptolyngbya sp. CCNP1308 TaxID=3110255 RepID=UPI002B21CDE8|nr:GIY-YIG nuclease family protein [Leptolyngbya sp. CCNP1308]MEA5447584.1 GIY-YIG nuclease family protein [Leptolyngbya sp. CCNP1308]
MRTYKLAEYRLLPETTGIYSIVNTRNGKIYIGGTQDKKGFKSRFSKHFNLLHQDKHNCIPLQRAFNAYGLDGFEVWILEECEASKVLFFEQYYFDTWEPWADNDAGYNLCRVAGSTKHFAKSEETELCSFLVYGGERRKGVSCWMKQTTRPGIHHE